LSDQLRPRAVEAILRRSMDELRLKTASHVEAWGLGNTARFEVDRDDGVISFTNPGLLVVAPVQVIGSYNSQEGAWLWGWQHPELPEVLARDAKLAREFGEKHGPNRYTTPFINSTEDEAWEFTALACHLARASGAYRAPVGDVLFSFMTFHDVKIRGKI
jgi:hypothetical protein